MNCDSSFTELLIAVFPHLLLEQRSASLAQVISNSRSNIFSLAYDLKKLLPYLPPEQQIDLITQALENTLPYSDYGIAFADAFKAIVPHLVEHTDLLFQVTQTVRSSLPEKERMGVNPRAQALVALAPLLSPNQQTDVVVQVLDMTDALPEVSLFRGASRIELLAALVPTLANRPDLLTQVLNRTLSIKDIWPRISMLVTLAAHLAGYPTLLARILDNTCNLPETSPLGQNPRFVALLNLLPHLARHQDLLARALEIIDSFQDADEQAMSLATLIPYLSSEQQQNLLDQTLIAARLIKSKSARVRACIDLISLLQSNQQIVLLTEALSTARSIEDKERRDQTIALLIPHLLTKPSLMTEALEVIFSIKDVDIQKHCFTTLIPYLSDSPDLRIHILDLLSTHDDVRRINILETLNPFLDNLPLARLYLEWRTIIHSSTESTREHLLSNLASITPVLSKLGGKKAVIETIRVISDTYRRWP